MAVVTYTRDVGCMQLDISSTNTYTVQEIQKNNNNVDKIYKLTPLSYKNQIIHRRIEKGADIHHI